MKSISGTIGMLSIFVAGGCASPKTVPDSTSLLKPMAKTLHYKSVRNIDVGYLLFLPAEYSRENEKKWPLLLFLHGSGERGTDVWKVAAHGPPKIATNNAAFPFILVAPQCPAGQIWEREPLLALLDEIIRKYSIDTSRVYLTGLSMGGYATWELGTAHPERFAAIAPVCGGGEFISVLLSSREKAAALKSLGIWAFHGAKDPVVPVEESRRMVDAVRKAGAKDVKLAIYPEAEHDSWTETYKNPELYQWLLEHQRTPSRGRS